MAADTRRATLACVPGPPNPAHPLETRQASALVPEPPGCFVVLSFLRWLSQAAPVEVGAAQLGDRVRRGEIDDCFSSLFWRYCEQFGGADHMSEDAATFIPEASRDKSGMQAVGRNACVAPTPR